MVVGAGRMGSALATALFHKGFATTVWNRTGGKTEVLAKLGLHVAPSLEESVREADIVVVSLSDYSSTRQVLGQPGIETALRGKIVVQLSSGTPQDAREMDSWARRCGIEYLDGAILGSPGWIEHQPAPSSIPGRRKSSSARSRFLCRLAIGLLSSGMKSAMPRHSMLRSSPSA